jgi:hypothetical protein
LGERGGVLCGFGSSKNKFVYISTQIIEQRKPKSKVEHHYAKRSTINGKGNNNNPLNINSQKGRQRANCSQKGPEYYSRGALSKQVIDDLRVGVLLV